MAECYFVENISDGATSAIYSDENNLETFVFYLFS